MLSVLHSMTNTGVRLSALSAADAHITISARGLLEPMLGAALLIHLFQAVAIVVDQGADEPLPDYLLGLVGDVAPFVAQRYPQPVAFWCRASAMVGNGVPGRSLGLLILVIRESRWGLCQAS